MMIYGFTFFILGIAILVAAISVRGSVDASGLVIATFLAAGALVLLASKIYRKRLGSSTQSTTLASSQQNGFLPDARKFVLSMAFLCYLLAAVDVISTGSLSTSGRWAWLMNLAIEGFGPYGKAILFFIFGIILTIIGLLKK